MMTRLQSRHLLVLVLAFYATISYSKGRVCSEYGLGESSSCTGDLASRYYIDKLEGNTDLVALSSTSVIIPDITFACNGAITEWILGANLVNGTSISIELEIWRFIRESTPRSRMESKILYRKIDSTRITSSGSANGYGLHHYVLVNPMEFQAGDIFGISYDDGVGAVYLEDSKRFRVYRTDDPSGPGGPTDESEIEVSTDEVEEGEMYPLITAVTDPPNCGCDFMSVDRISQLLNDFTTNIAEIKDTVESWGQLIFPNAKFNCHGEVLKWIIGGTCGGGRSNDMSLEFQIWREVDNHILGRINSTTVEQTASDLDSVFEFILDPPLPFQPGDMLGVFQSRSSELEVDFNQLGSTLFYSISTSQPLETFDTQQELGGGASDTTGPRTHSRPDILAHIGLPLVSVEIVNSYSDFSLHPTTSTASFHDLSSSYSPLSTTHTMQSSIVHSTSYVTVSSTSMQPSTSPTTNGKVSAKSFNPMYIVITCIVAGSVGVLSFVTILLLCWRRRKQKVEQNSTSMKAGEELDANPSYRPRNVSTTPMKLVPNGAYDSSKEAATNMAFVTSTSIEQSTSSTDSSHTTSTVTMSTTTEPYYDYITSDDSCGYSTSNCDREVHYDYPYGHFVAYNQTASQNEA